MLFKLDEVYKSYSGNEILKGVSFQINPFEKVGLVGRNGAGKTTAFKIATGEESPDTGNVSRIKGLKIGLLKQHIDFEANETVHSAALSAFKELLDTEAKMRKLEQKMTEDSSKEILDEYAKLQVRFESEGGFEYTAKAESVLLGLNFSKEQWELETGKLSGGQKNRLGMARLLLSEPDILLLDEPTNHLDVQTVGWLENYLENYEQAYVIISHDRYFLDKTCSKIIEIENGKAFTYKGNYTKFVKESTLQKEQRQREYENQQAYIKKTEEFVRKNLAGQKTKQAKSRRTMLQKMRRLEAVKTEKRSGNFALKNVERAGTNVVSIEDLSIGYPDAILGENINFLLFRGERLGVIGGNGTGKTTFLKTLLGGVRELSGKITWGTKVNIGYYSQKLEELEKNNDLIAEMRRINPLAENGELRSFLAGFLFFGEDVFKKVSELSGGEKGRLSLAKLIYSKANVLILDEPTNHLDIPSREALEQALKEFEGTIITVSHDRYFLDQIATQILAIDEDQKIDTYSGNYSQYYEWKEKQIEESVSENKPKTNSDKTTKTDNSDSLSKNERHKYEKSISKIEAEITKHEEKLKELTLKMGEIELAVNKNELSRVTVEYQKTEKLVKELYVEWENITDILG